MGLLVFGRHVFLLAFAAILLALLVSGLGDFLRRFIPIGRAASDVLGIVLVILFFTISTMLAAPSIEQQTEKLVEELPRSIEAIRSTVEQYPVLQNGVDRISQNFSWQNLAIGGRELILRAGGLAGSALGAVLNLLIVVVMAAYLLVNPQVYKKSFVRMFHPKKRKKANEMLTKLAETLQWWLAGRLLSMLIIGVATTIGLMILGVPLAFLLGLFAALISFIPNIGPILSAIPAVLLGFSQSPTMALYVAMLYIGIQLIESNLLTPIIERKTVSIQPAFLLLVQIFFSLFFGLLGLTLASPIVAAVIVLVRGLYIEPMEENEK